MSADKSRLYPFTRIAVVGTTGAGKTTMAQQLARRLGLPHVELDALHWDANWIAAPRDQFRQRVAHALAGDAWVVDGNYSKARDLVWAHAQQIVWLDYPLPVILWQLLRRTLRRTLLREELWNGNRERLRDQFFSRDSLFWWALSTSRGLRERYHTLLAQPEHAGLAVVYLRSPRSARAWLDQLPGCA